MCTVDLIKPQLTRILLNAIPRGKAVNSILVTSAEYAQVTFRFINGLIGERLIFSQSLHRLLQQPRTRSFGETLEVKRLAFFGTCHGFDSRKQQIFVWHLNSCSRFGCVHTTFCPRFRTNPNPGADFLFRLNNISVRQMLLFTLEPSVENGRSPKLDVGKSERIAL